MNSTVLSEESITLIGKLAELQEQKNKLQGRIQLYETKLGMAREANLVLVDKEQELINKIQAQGFHYGTAPAPTVTPAQGQMLQTPTSEKMSEMLSTLFHVIQNPM